MRRLALTIVLLDGWRRALVAFLAGAVTTFGLAPFNVPAAGFIGFPILVWMLDGAAGAPGRGLIGRLWPAFAVGWWFGWGYFVGGLWWLGAAMTNDGDAFLWAIPFAALGLPAVLGVYFGLAGALARALWTDGPGRIVALAASLTLFELLRGRLFTGFSWNEIGVLAAPVPLMMQSVSVVGIHGLTLGAVLVFAMPALLCDEKPSRIAVALAGGLLVAHLGFGAVRLGVTEPGTVDGVSLRIVQPDILQSQKWDAAEADRIYDRLVTLTRRPDGPPPPDGHRTLVVWPESAFPFLLTERPDAIARLADALAPSETLIAGAARREATPDLSEARYYNSIYVVDEAGEILDASDKLHLVPFGEYLPFQSILERLGVTQLATLPGGFSAGAERAPVALAGGVPSFLPLICYEIIFPDEIDVSGPSRPGFIVNVTNDAWYGATPGPYQHLRHAELTAVAFGLPLVRAANTGISVVTDAMGRPLAGLALGSAGTVEAALPASLPSTFFSRNGNAGFWIVFAMAWIATCAFAIRDTRND